MSSVSVENQLNMSSNRSGHVRNVKGSTDIGVQVDSPTPQPKIRKLRDCTDKIKSACSEISVKCNISSETARLATQINCHTLYGHEYYLTKEDAINKDPSLAEYREDTPAPSKRRRVKSTTEKTKPPVSLNDYKPYENVLPSAKTINDFKQRLAIQHEQEAAQALHNIKTGTKVTLHFDATSRSKIDGDWPSLILIFSDKRRFPLRPLFFAYEDRVQIVRLIVETYKRLVILLIFTSWFFM